MKELNALKFLIGVFGGLALIVFLIFTGDYVYNNFGEDYLVIYSLASMLGLICIIFRLNIKNQKSATFEAPPKTNFQNYLMVPHIESLVNYFIKHEKQISLVNSDCVVTLFQQGHVPTSEEFNNPKKMETIDQNVKINNPQKWLLSKLWLDLINLKNLSEKINISLENVFVDYLSNLGLKIDKMLITYGLLAQKYNINDLEKNWMKEIDKIANKEEKESFKTNYVSDTLLSAEVRIIAWIYKELFNKDFKFKK